MVVDLGDGGRVTKPATGVGVIQRSSKSQEKDSPDDLQAEHSDYLPYSAFPLSPPKAHTSPPRSTLEKAASLRPPTGVSTDWGSACWCGTGPRKGWWLGVVGGASRMSLVLFVVVVLMTTVRWWVEKRRRAGWRLSAVVVCWRRRIA